jgi:23S rRNA pseudouridine1911/1915/1917 synthase
MKNPPRMHDGAPVENVRRQRLDQYVVEQMPALSRAYAAKLCDEGKIIVNGLPNKAGYKVRLTDVIQINYDPVVMGIVPDIDLPIIYEDADCAVIDKPIGILTHSKGAFNPEGTVASFMRSHVNNFKILDGERAGIVHRLDRATSGVIICAKHPEALAWMQKQFADRKVKKTYIAVITGHLKEPTATIDMPIERNPKKPQTFRVGINGKTAQTTYTVLEERESTSLIELKPATGRTHQLRVHLSHLGHPIVGDLLYSGPTADRLYLHAKELELTLYNHERKVFTSPLPASFNNSEKSS